MSDVNLSTFPCNKYQSLTLLYLQVQNLNEVSPEGLAEMYSETEGKIRQAFKDIRQRKNNSD